MNFHVVAATYKANVSKTYRTQQFLSVWSQKSWFATEAVISNRKQLKTYSFVTKAMTIWQKSGFDQFCDGEVVQGRQIMKICLCHGFLWKRLPHDCQTTTPRLPHDYSTTTQRLLHDYPTTTPRPPWTHVFRVLQISSLGTQKYVKTMCLIRFVEHAQYYVCFKRCRWTMYRKPFIS